jgi:hypothetical protein
MSFDLLDRYCQERDDAVGRDACMVFSWSSHKRTS